MKKKFYWKEMNKDIEEYVEQCEICQKERPQSKFKDIVPLIANNVGDIWEIDLVGPFKESEYVFKYVVTMIDHFSKCAEAIPVYTKDMNTIVHLVDKYIVKKIWTPKVILTDNGREFKNQVCESFAKERNII
ncbi:Retrovirus-related Pol polyprotein from transposon [Nosema granulosis]|uniref:Retrovirus-related Pol polyprotein from transposon n=1 Tax=Nosema granulosis TaxID=83296 RepID=A0A9P6GUX1_9MICR|nr:Retrovirus-related Pol polyprotein from transposon [Nosema granulosis]